MAVSDPYEVLGIPHSADDAEIRAAYRRQVKLHHPDHNGGSPESTRRFEQIQDAYALVWKLRGDAAARARPTGATPNSPPADPGLEARLAEMEREIQRARKAKADAQREAERMHQEALRQAREAARADGERPSDEELGYITTDDSFSAILDDAAEHAADLFDALGARLRGEQPPGQRSDRSDPDSDSK